MRLNGREVPGGAGPIPFARRLALPRCSGMDSRVFAFAPLGSALE